MEEKYITCSKCGKLQELHYINNAELEERCLCFKCSFWYDRTQEYNNPELKHAVFVSNGVFYHIGDENAGNYFKGFGGAKVTITFLDGTIIKSSNLWCRGDVPDNFKDILKENAELVWHW